MLTGLPSRVQAREGNGCACAGTRPYEDVSRSNPSITPLDPRELVNNLESRWDERFSRMETAIRSGLTSSATVSTAWATGVQPAVAAVVSSKGKEKKSKTDTSKKQSRHRSPSPELSSSESESDSSSSSSDDDSESDREVLPKRKSKKKKKGKYDASKFLDEGDKIDSFERLILANLRMAIKLLKKEHNIKGLLQHLVLITEKAEKCMFANDSLCKYDEAVRATANEKGLRTFGKIDPTTIFKFLTYDGTLAAERAKHAADSNKKQSRGRSGAMYACYAYNNTSEGCKGNCGYRHICSSGGAQNHLIGVCPTRKPSSGRSK